MKLIKRLNIIIALLIGFGIGYFTFSEGTSEINEYNYFETNYLTKIGSTMMLNDETDWLSYELRSFDGGKIWYAVETDVNNGSLHEHNYFVFALENETRPYKCYIADKDLTIDAADSDISQLRNNETTINKFKNFFR